MRVGPRLGISPDAERPHGDVTSWKVAYRDPITAQGISDAFIDAELLVEALDAGLAGRAVLNQVLGEHESARNERVRPMYEFTHQLAALGPPLPHMQQLFGALRENQDATNAFFSAVTGAISLRDFMSETLAASGIVIDRLPSHEVLPQLSAAGRCSRV